MKLLEERIRKDGVVKPGNVLKVDSFLNHQMDVIFFNEMAKEFKRLYEGVPINKILTIEASGIGIAIMAGLHLEVPVVFAKKSRSSNISDQVYHTVIHSYTILPQLINSSILCALHPEILATANIGVKSSCGSPSILYTKPL